VAAVIRRCAKFLPGGIELMHIIAKGQAQQSK